MSLSYDPATDLLGHTAPLGHTLELPLLGVPVRYRSNSPAVIAATARALRIWQELPRALVEAGPPLQVDLVVHPVGPGDPAPSQMERFLFRAHGDTLVAAMGGNLLTAQLAQGSALGFITPELAANEPLLRHSVIECLGLLLVNYRDRTPIHAAGVVRNGRAVLLLGASKAGKSTLCYACVRAGFGLLSEDTVCVSLAHGLRVWGHPGPIQLLPDAPRLFPELASLEPQLRPNGKYKLSVDIGALGAERLATHAERAIVCLIARAPGQASQLEPLPAATAAALIADPQEPGFTLLRARAPAVAAALTAAGGAYRLSVGSNPASAAALLAHLTES